jgi:hypothetical protein
MITKRDSPQFSELLFWLKKKDIQELQRFFPLRAWMRRTLVPNVDGMLREKSVEKRFYWEKIKYKKYLSYIDLDVLRAKLKSELIDPLFLKPGLNIKDEDDAYRHRKDNLFSLTEILYRDLKDESKDLQKTIADYHRDVQKFLPGIGTPLRWVFGKTDSQKEHELRRNIEKLSEEIEKISKACRKLNDNILDRAFHDWRVRLDRRDEDFLAKRYVELPEIKRMMAINEVGGILAYLRAARGKPGRHPKPFNVFVYHLINKCTRRKWDKNRRYIFRRDGQHRLERDWNLILFLLLDVHVHQTELPELERFISKNARRPVLEVLQILKKRLWDIYKNFAPHEGWSFPRRLDETGFRKLVVGDDGRLQIIQL